MMAYDHGKYLQSSVYCAYKYSQSMNISNISLIENKMQSLSVNEMYDTFYNDTNHQELEELDNDNENDNDNDNESDKYDNSTSNMVYKSQLSLSLLQPNKLQAAFEDVEGQCYETTLAGVYLAFLCRIFLFFCIGFAVFLLRLSFCVTVHGYFKKLRQNLFFRFVRPKMEHCLTNVPRNDNDELK